MEITLWSDDARIAPVTSAAQRHDVRTRLYLRVEHDGVAGFGEVSPQPHALHTDPGLDEVLEEVVGVAVPQLLEVSGREGAVPDWTRVARFAGSRRASPAATALVEMAVLDRQLRASSCDATTLWPPATATPHQGTVSLLDDDDWVPADGVARVRVKTAPGAVSATARERVARLRVPVLLDFNCSASTIEEVLEQVAVLRGLCELAAVEQPFAPGNLIDHARLANRLDVPVSLDEGIRAPRDLDRVARYGAGAMVCVKPARVGGLANAHTMVRRARNLGLAVYLGGFFESPFARAVHRVLAEHCVTEPSDLGPVSRLDGREVEVDPAPWAFRVVPAAALLGAARLRTVP